MAKIDNFKKFVSNHPEFVDYVRNNKVTWQSFYELYDIYGEDNKAWSPYLNSSSEGLSENITDKLKNIDVSSIQEHIKTAQKALNLVSELTGKTETTTPLTASLPKVPRPINHFFED